IFRPSSADQSHSSLTRRVGAAWLVHWRVPSRARNGEWRFQENGSYHVVTFAMRIRQHLGIRPGPDHEELAVVAESSDAHELTFGCVNLSQRKASFSKAVDVPQHVQCPAS